jgi:RNA polymerase sigma-70 factor (ECF subfamily)
MEKALTGALETAPVVARDRALSASDFEVLVPALERRINRLIRSITRDGDCADTLTQECFLRAYRQRERFRGESSVETWLLRIAVNLALDSLKSRRRRFWDMLRAHSHEGDAGPCAEPADAEASAEEALVLREDAKAVWAACDDLSPRQRTVFVLRFGEEMSLDEIAETAQMEIGTVKAHLNRALCNLRKRLKERR